jgi:hypothetical protein
MYVAILSFLVLLRVIEDYLASLKIFPESGQIGSDALDYIV